MTPIDISPKDLETVKAILAAQVPEYEVRAFGSRVQWTSKDSSDLDLVVMTEKPLEAVRLADLKEAFSESDLPFKVDVVDWAGTKEGFRKIIEKQFAAIQKVDIRNAEVTGKWKEVSIAEIALKLSMGPFGSNIKTDNFVPTGVPVVRGNNLNSGRFNPENFVYLTEKKADELASANAFPGDIVFTHRGTLGQIGIIPEGLFNRYVVSQSQMKMTCDPERADPLFIYYYFKSPAGQHALLMNTSQTGVPAISRPITSLKAIRLLMPPLPEQRAIAHILGTLDDKIELNRSMNQKLEEIAQAIFKSWFVDFDPVRRKVAGKKTGLPEDIDKLFPEEFEPSELGEIPKGWNLGKLSDFGKIITGKTPSTNNMINFGNEVAFITPSDMDGSKFIIQTERYLSEEGKALVKSSFLPAKSVLVSCIGSDMGKVTINICEAITNQQINAIIPQKPEYAELPDPSNLTAVSHFI